MLNKFLLSLFIVAISFLSINAQEENPDVEKLRFELFSTYGYCKSQDWTFQRIADGFPELKLEIIQAKAEFDITFGQSCTNVQNIISKILGSKLAEYDKTLKDRLADAIDYSKLNFQSSQSFINKVRERAKGNIESPFKESLLAFNPTFAENPGAEFSRGFTKKYRTNNHPKAKGLDFEISVPISWKAREGNRPNVIQFFKEKNGYGNTYMLLMVLEIPTLNGIKPTQKEIDSIFTSRGLKEFIPENGTFIEGKPIVLEGQKGAMLTYDMVEQRLELKLRLRFLSYIVYYKSRLIMIQFATSGKEEDTESIVKEFVKNRPLFQLVANSFILMDKYK